jgi:hypothetical protein
MTNALLCDATGRRRLFLCPSPAGPPQAAKTAEGFGGLMYTHLGEIDYRHKTYLNLAHWPEAVGYAVYAWEQFRGAARPVSAPVEPQFPHHQWGRA